MTTNRLPVVLLVTAAIVYACGPHPQSAEKRPGSRTVSGPEVGSTLDVRVAKNVSFAFRVTNNAAKRVELLFPSGQTYDFVVTDTLGRVLWQWSEGRAFTQAIRSSVLEREESKIFEAAWQPDSLRGAFFAVASLRSENHPVERRVRFELP